jgi:prepilin-type N-terminal cleavage/methylation domain-containing protein
MQGAKNMQVANANANEKSRAGFSLIEALIVVAIIGVIAAMAGPTILGGTTDERLKAGARNMAAAFSYARSEAIRTGDIHIVFVGTDASGNALPDTSGDPAIIAVVNDGQPGSANQNCQINAGEIVSLIAPSRDITGGTMAGVAQMPEDLGAGDLTTGSTFTEPDGITPASWVLFRPEGTVHAFDAGCVEGALGSGGGGIYIHNGQKQFGILLRPLGGTRVRLWTPGGVNQWAT